MDKKRSLILLTCTLLLGGLLLAAGLATAATSSPTATPEPAAHTDRAGLDASWSSGWVPITAGSSIVFNHNLGGDPNNYAVDLWFRDTDGLFGINRRGYGEIEVNGQWIGAHWQNLTSNTVTVVRGTDDGSADLVRVTVWEQTTTPDYDSGWTAIAPGETVTFSHSLGITATDLSVRLWFSGTARGIHHFGLGGLEISGIQSQMVGAHWFNLTDNTVQVTRNADDTDIEQVRVTVNEPPAPDYDSLVALGDWASLSVGQGHVFAHNLNWPPELLLVRAECRSPADGIHQRFAGGFHGETGFQGADTRDLTANTVTLFRWPQDTVCPEARITVWKQASRVYVPVVMKNYPPVVETELAHDDGTMDSTTSYEIGKGYAVCFSPPGGSATLVRARYYLQDPRPIEVHVWSADAHADLITPFQADLTLDGWNDVDLSAYNLTVNGDFCVGFLHLEDYRPTLGVDTTAPVDDQSYEIDGAYWELQGYDAMIRAVVTGP